ncbi:MAG: haloacid dehalogenase-like hydrolase [Bacteroidales bacterium]|nr:haloacid dehalogenase-like hydrolase [Bacteroidales bacterium]
MKENKPIIALIYDFDGTLSPRNMQEYSFIQAIGQNDKEFWGKAQEMADKQDSDNILVYMLLMLQKAKETGLPIRKEIFQKFGESVELFNGVANWFKRINEYGKAHGVKIEHYINSSGNKEIIEGTKIAKEFKAIFASSFYYDNNGDALWPAAAVNYTNKTQFLFKINKGIFSVKDSIITNSSVPEEKKRVAFTNMVYFGDGETDVPCMKLIKQLGGTSIAVYEPGNEKKKESARKLIKQDRVNFVCPADYSQSSSLDTLVKAIINKLKADDNLRELKKEFTKDIKSK